LGSNLSRWAFSTLGFYGGGRNTKPSTRVAFEQICCCLLRCRCGRRSAGGSQALCFFSPTETEQGKGERMRGLLGRRRPPPPLPLFPAAKRRAHPPASLLARISRLLPDSRLLRLLLLLAVLSLVPPAFFHLRLRRFHRVRLRTRPLSRFDVFLGGCGTYLSLLRCRCGRGSAGGSRARRWCARTAGTPPTRSPIRYVGKATTTSFDQFAPDSWRIFLLPFLLR
jgi:hypothetical protein